MMRGKNHTGHCRANGALRRLCLPQSPSRSSGSLKSSV